METQRKNEKGGKQSKMVQYRYMNGEKVGATNNYGIGVRMQSITVTLMFDFIKVNKLDTPALPTRILPGI